MIDEVTYKKFKKIGKEMNAIYQNYADALDAIP